MNRIYILLLYKDEFQNILEILYIYIQNIKFQIISPVISIQKSIFG